MKKLSLFLVACVGFSSISAHAACEYEKDRAEKNRTLCNTWGQVSGGTAFGGMVIGGLLWGPVGGLLGAVGLIPGAVAKRVCDLADEKDRILQDCLNHQVVLQEQAKEAEKQLVIETKSQAAGQFLGRLFMQKKAEYQMIVAREVDALIEQFLDSGRDLSDPATLLELEEESRRIESRYY